MRVQGGESSQSGILGPLCYLGLRMSGFRVQHFRLIGARCEVGLLDIVLYRYTYTYHEQEGGDILRYVRFHQEFSDLVRF